MRISGLGRYASTTEMKNSNRKGCFQTRRKTTTFTCREITQIGNREFLKQRIPIL